MYFRGHFQKYQAQLVYYDTIVIGVVNLSGSRETAPQPIWNKSGKTVAGQDQKKHFSLGQA
jgi:hypothetical protein